MLVPVAVYCACFYIHFRFAAYSDNFKDETGPYSTCLSSVNMYFFFFIVERVIAQSLKDH